MNKEVEKQKKQIKALKKYKEKQIKDTKTTNEEKCKTKMCIDLLNIEKYN